MPTIIKETKALEKIINSSQSFFLTLHMVPDADACGSMLCFAEVLKNKGKKVYIYSYDRINESLLILPGVNEIRNEITSKSFDVAVFFECSTPHRAGINISDFKFKKTISIDHHLTSERYADLNIIYPNYPSTAEIIYHILKKMGLPLTKTMAINLYAGIITDTGRFQYPQTKPQTLKTAAKLISFGFDFYRINEIFFNRTTYKNLKLLSVALSTLEIDNSIACMVIRQSDFEKYNADFMDTDNIINYPMMIEDVLAAFLIKEDMEKYSVTFRSRKNIDVSYVASKFGGGGHINASGFKISKKSIDSIEVLKDKVKQCLRKEIEKKNHS